MVTVSNDFKTAMKQPIKEIQAFIDYDESSIRDSDDLISFKISCDSGLCKTAMRKLEGKYLGSHNLLGKWVRVGFGVRLPNGEFEYLNFGSFLVTELTISKDTDTTSIVGYDKMINAMTTYSTLAVEYPIDLYTYTKLLCEVCNLELGNLVFGENLCPTNINKWELGAYSLIDGNKENYPARARLTDLLSVPTDTTLYLNTFLEDYSFVVRGYDENGTFIKSYGGVSNGSTIDTTGVSMLGVAVYNLNDSTETQGQVIIDNISSRIINPIICLNDDMRDWVINGELWENIEGITYRDILVQIAQATASTCIIGADDKVYFKKLTDTGEYLTYDNMFKLKLEALYGEINSVVLSRTPSEDNIYLQDEASVQRNGLTEFKIENNEIIDKDRENAITPIFDILNGVSYYPFETTTEGLGWYEIADNITIVNDLGEEFKTSLFNYSITIDGSIKETLKTTAESKTHTQYQYATTLSKRVKNTEVIVNKQDQYIKQLVSDMYEENGVVNEKYTQIYQNIDGIVNSVQNSGGNNLIKNSVMFAYNSKGVPSEWVISDEGDLIISANAEALNAGGLSGHSFTLADKLASQTVSVSTNTYYTFSTRIKKDITGSCYVRLYNSNEEHIIEVAEGESAYYNEYEIKSLLPTDNYYIVEFYGSVDSNATFTDNMLAVGEYKSQWTQANGEVMNTQVNINLDGILVKSSRYLGDYTAITPLEFAGYSNINGTITKVFSLNKDVTEVKKLLAKDEIKMPPIKIVPITEGDLQGWAFVPST